MKPTDVITLPFSSNFHFLNFVTPRKKVQKILKHISATSKIDFNPPKTVTHISLTTNTSSKNRQNTIPNVIFSGLKRRSRSLCGFIFIL